KFILERSTDGINWEFLTEYKAAGRSQQSIQYQGIDNSPFLGVNYYRLVQVDFDGSKTYSNTEKALITDHSELTAFIYPNPTFDVINIQFANQDFKQRKLT